jgi:hypothetical protein
MVACCSQKKALEEARALVAQRALAEQEKEVEKSIESYNVRHLSCPLSLSCLLSPITSALSQFFQYFRKNSEVNLCLRNIWNENRKIPKERNTNPKKRNTKKKRNTTKTRNERGMVHSLIDTDTSKKNKTNIKIDVFV